MTIAPKAVSFLIQGKEIVGELWGEANRMPVIALHGWLDNCHSFRPLAPQLENIQLLALDMAGHGHSEHRSADASYHIWDDVREVLMIANDMGWSEFTLMGHSRGAIIATLIAAIAPERIKKLVLIEGIWPETMLESDAPKQLARFVNRYLSFDGVEKGYQSREAMMMVRRRGSFDIGDEALAQLVARNTEFREGYFYWRTDVRLTMPSPMMLTVPEAESFIKAVQCPTLLLMASQGLGQKMDFLDSKIAANPRINVMILDGGHHLHMERARDRVAQAINAFLCSD